MTSDVLLRVLQLASPALPVGAYSYSQGLEWAVETGKVCDQASARQWIEDVLVFSVCALDLPVCARLHAAWSRTDAQVQYWNDLYLASRETAEFRAESLQMGYSLRKILTAARMLEQAWLARLAEIRDLCYPTAFVCASAAQGVSVDLSLSAYAWSWAENQAIAAVKLVPLGQVAGQAMLHDLAARMPSLVSQALETEDEAITNFAPGLAIASSRHETQYSRLFRS